MRVLVTGGRDYRDRDRVAAVLQAVHSKHGISAVIQGGADGADLLCAQWAWDRSIPVGTFNAKWEDIDRPGAVIKTRRDGTKYGALAGLHRNERMLAGHSTVEHHDSDQIIRGLVGDFQTANVRLKKLKVFERWSCRAVNLLHLGHLQEFSQCRVVQPRACYANRISNPAVRHPQVVPLQDRLDRAQKPFAVWFYAGVPDFDVQRRGLVLL